jgi:serine/threonine-protein kinase HipA
LISNADDHPRNHAVIAWDRSWRLSPAYDLTPAPATGMERDLAMVVGNLGRRATAQNLVTQCRRFLLTREEATAIVSDMAKRVRSEWHGVARAAKVSVRDCQTIGGAFENDGFWFEAEAGAGIVTA